MPRFTTLDRHSLYPIEIWGETLVVSPRGDAAGFNPTAVHHEMATVTELAQSPGVQHLIIDFSGANYFGSIVLGGLVQLTQTVKNRGGRVAICNASGDMQDILRILKLDALWEHFPDRRVALNRVAKIPLPLRLWGLRKVAAVTAAVLLLIAAYVFYPRPNYGRIYYEQVHALWREYHEREKLAGEEEWRQFSERSTRKMKPMIEHITRRSDAGAMKPAELFVLYVMRDYWPKMLERNSEGSRVAAKWAQRFLRDAEANLEGRAVGKNVVLAPGAVGASPSTIPGTAVPADVPATKTTP